MTGDSYLALAETIGQQISSAAVHARDGTATWCFKYPASHPGPRRVFLSPHLYAGVSGIAIFLAALHRSTGKRADYDLCLKAMAPMRRETAAIAADPQRALGVKHGLGGLCGLGSFIYSLIKVGDLLELADLYHDAHSLSALITQQRIAADQHLDVMSGSAGAILALLALHRVMPQENANGDTPLQLAAACGDHLVAKRLSYQGRPKAWTQDADHRPAASFAHGAAGICHALLQLHELTQDPRLWQAVEEGLAFERTMYVPERRNWIASFGPGDCFSNSWCNGAPGVALGRAGSLHLCDTPRVREDLDWALATTQSETLSEGDFICCGNLGRVDVLLYASQRMAHSASRRTSLSRTAHQLAAKVIQRAESAGGFALMPGEIFRFDPRLFVGLTGVGYTLLRLSGRASLPSLMAME